MVDKFHMILETECHWRVCIIVVSKNFGVEAGVFGVEGSTPTTPIDRTLARYKTIMYLVMQHLTIVKPDQENISCFSPRLETREGTETHLHMHH